MEDDPLSEVEAEILAVERDEKEEEERQQYDEEDEEDPEFVEWPGGLADYTEALKAQRVQNPTEPADSEMVREGLPEWPDKDQVPDNWK